MEFLAASASEKAPASATRKLIRWMVEAHIETADMRRGERARAFVEAVMRIAGEEIAAANILPLRGDVRSNAEREALMQAAEALEEMHPTLVAKLPPP